jgi:hypothetical protein
MIATAAEEKKKKLTDHEIRELVDRGGKLSKELAAAKPKFEELDLIKAQLRDLARGKDRAFTGFTHTAVVEQKPDTISRVVDESLLPRVLKLAGDVLHTLFTLHPRKGAEKNFELNALKTLPKKAAGELVDLLTETATAWVRFS